MISITVQNDQTIPVVVPAGRLDTTTCAELDKVLVPLMEQHPYLILDMSECNYLSSFGIRLLLTSEKKLVARGGRLLLSGIIPEVFQVIEMTGLHQIFSMVENPEAAHREIQRIRQKMSGFRAWQSGNYYFHFHPIDHDRQPARFWNDPGIAGYDELGIAIGTGSPADTPEEEKEARGIFISTRRCAGFIPDDTRLSPDFRLPQNPAQAGIYVKQAISFGKQPVGFLRLAEAATISLDQLAEALYPMKQKITADRQDAMALVIADVNPAAPSVSVCLVVDLDLNESVKRLNDSLSGLTLVPKHGIRLWGARFLLGEAVLDSDDISLSNFLDKALTIENVIGVDTIKPDDKAVNPMTWMFISDSLEDAALKRLRIDTVGDFTFEPHKAFLTRRLYTDSARLEIKQIHGGYSALTFQVTSFDQHNRKMRPTVLKTANRAMIARESERCQKYALPYILNNSAMVLGTEFFGDIGALRYNFVGIGGESTPLKWLTHYYDAWPSKQLEPLFDKIFLQILNPWYGQPIQETIHPFRDHDPIFTFFPRLCETAVEELSVTPVNQHITVQETGQQIINPYWFLKNEFSRRRDEGIRYFTGICHGDLNMQNILLDEDMNVYLIDFSETKPRSLISDFARLEAIFMVDRAPMENEEDAEEYVKFICRFYENLQPGQPPVNSYRGRHREVVEKNVAFTRKMREYAFNSVKGDPNPVPYCLALLEWVLPIVCYWTISPAHKRLSMIVSGLLCGKVDS